ncbi:MAG: hypothetical protein O3C23_00780 [bacterium]|nr:hypothetical protein [bacterium]
MFSDMLTWFVQLLVLLAVFVLILPVSYAIVMFNHPTENMEAPIEIWKHSQRELINLFPPLKKLTWLLKELAIQFGMLVSIIPLWGNPQFTTRRELRE